MWLSSMQALHAATCLSMQRPSTMGFVRCALSRSVVRDCADGQDGPPGAGSDGAGIPTRGARYRMCSAAPECVNFSVHGQRSCWRGMEESLPQFVIIAGAGYA